MAKSAAALHILVKEEKLAQEILAKLERGVSFDHLAKRYSTAAISESLIKESWLGRSIRQSSAARCSNLTGRSKPSLATTSLRCCIAASPCYYCALIHLLFHQGTIMAKTAAALHILVKEEQLALDLLEQIKNGADFGKLAKKHSICPSGKRGGDLGEFRQGQMVPAFDKVVFSCPELEPTGPLHTQFGYHIIKVLYRK